MADKRKGLIAGMAIAGSALLAVGIALLKKKPVPPPEEGERAADIEILVYDAQGNLVPRNSPLTLAEGQTYTVVPRMKNRSIKRTATEDIPIAASFGMGMVVNIGSYYPPGLGGIAQNYQLVSFAAGETKSVGGFPAFTVPSNAGGQTGKIYLEIYAPTGEFLKSAQEPIAVAVSQIIYDVEITFV